MKAIPWPQAARPSMRIAFYAPRASFLGPNVVGETTHISNLFAALRRRGHAVDVVSDVNVRDFWRGRRPPWGIVREALAIRRRVRRFRPDAWLVFGANETYPDLFGWWQVGTPYVLLAIDPWSSRRMPRRWQVPFELAFRASLKRARKVGAHRPRCGDRLRSMGIADDKLELFLPAIAIPESVPDQSDARRRLRLPQAGAVVLCISRLPEGKERHKTDAVIDLVSVADHLPADAMLVVVGGGDGRQRVLDAVANLSRRERVRVDGFADDTAPYYAACDLFANPVAVDRPWVTVIEAQAFGRPVVVMRSTSAEATVQDGRTGLLADDRAEFREHVVSLAADGERSRSMGRAAREYAASSHSIDRQVAEIETWLADR